MEMMIKDEVKLQHLAQSWTRDEKIVIKKRERTYRQISLVPGDFPYLDKASRASKKLSHFVIPSFWKKKKDFVRAKNTENG